jgi:two-component system, sensor histidine kinase and response regulator
VDTGRPLRVLLAEDNPVNQLVASRVLETHGHAVVIAHTGREALAALERERFDVVLMDVQMPEMSGLEATEEIRRRERGSGRRTVIVGLTAHARNEDRDRCLDAGMDAYLSKPFKAADLFQIFERLLPPESAVDEPSIAARH